MENFLLNMAVIKVNWDQSESDLLDNFMPLLGYAIKMCPNEPISLPVITEKLNEVAEFIFPQGAVNILIKRAAKKKYSYILRDADTFSKNHAILDQIDYPSKRDQVASRHMKLKQKFRAYSESELKAPIPLAEIDKYFFEVLFELAPQLLSRLNRDEDLKVLMDIRDKNSLKYRVFKFVEYLIHIDPEGYEAVDSFVRGAMLTETFYYSDPLEVGKRMRDIRVYFDTQFVLRALGYSDNYYVSPCKELIDMLKDMKVPMHIFHKTYDEIYGILIAARETRDLRSLTPYRPGDAFDYFARTGATSSDITLEIVRLEKNLEELGTTVVEAPPHAEALGVDEQKLNQYIDVRLPAQKDKSRQHDIDCLTAIFRLRLGQTEKFLESCRAIFITTNSKLARASTEFFNEEYGVSDAPICMTDHIFTALVWLKAVNKRPDLPKERMVANCYAASNPSDELWSKYITEAVKLQEKKNITEEDYAILVHTLDARHKLMSMTEGESEVFFEGSVPEILDYAKQRLIEETQKKVEEKDGQINKLTRKIDNFECATSDIVFKIVRIMTVVVIFVILSFGLIFSTPKYLWHSQQMESFFMWDYLAPAVFAILLVATLLNLVFGVRLVSVADRLAKAVSEKVRDFLKRRLED